MSKTEKDLAVACFDLQQVLLTPKGFESSLYYKRRLNTYNFSLYNYETADGFCYVWNESISGRGASEMASCVYDFIEKSSKNGKKDSYSILIMHLPKTKTSFISLCSGMH